MLYLWIKSLHLVFVISWFAGLFYLPRIFVNLAAVPIDSTAERERLLGMAKRLLRFMTMIAFLAIGLGLWLWWGWSISGGWLWVKIALVILLVLYHLSCDVLLDFFIKNKNRHSERWYRFYNEAPVFLLLAIVLLVILKPF
jgi:putative membrane protein